MEAGLRPNGERRTEGAEARLTQTPSPCEQPLPQTGSAGCPGLAACRIPTPASHFQVQGPFPYGAGAILPGLGRTRFGRRAQPKAASATSGRGPKRLRPAGEAREISSSRRRACTPCRPLPIPSSVSPAARAVGLPMSVRARAQAGAKGPPTGLAHPRAPGHRPPGPCRGREGGSAGCGRPRGGGFCGRPPRPRGGEERHREAWVPGMGRYGTGPQPGQQIWDSPGGGSHQNRRA